MAEGVVGVDVEDAARGAAVGRRELGLDGERERELRLARPAVAVDFRDRAHLDAAADEAVELDRAGRDLGARLALLLELEARLEDGRGRGIDDERLLPDERDAFLGEALDARELARRGARDEADGREAVARELGDVRGLDAVRAELADVLEGLFRVLLLALLVVGDLHHGGLRERGGGGGRGVVRDHRRVHACVG